MNMKRFFAIIASSLLVLSAVSCNKVVGSSEFPPYYMLSVAWHETGGTGGTSDFSEISNAVKKYRDDQFPSEVKAVEAYNDVIRTTANASFSAPEDSYFELSIAKYVGREVDEHTIQYESDLSYKSPVRHRWDAEGSRDL